MKKLFERYRDKSAALKLDRALERRSGLRWHRLPPCPLPLYDAGAAQIGSKLFVFGGYLSLERVNSQVFALDLETGEWEDLGKAPEELAHSHLAIADDSARYVYLASGQHGPQCSPAIAVTMSYDTRTGRWASLPPLPEPRYAGTMRVWRGRLHFVGGAGEDRWTPKDDHWTLDITDGQTTARNWTRKAPIPTPGMHRGSVLLNDSLFVFGGQQGDFVAIPGDPACRCDGHTQETYLSDCFRLDDPDGSWVRLADMPVPVSHSDFSIVQSEGRAFVLGGQIYKHPEEFYLRLTDAIQCYDPEDNRWSIAGHLPYPVKFPVAGIWNGEVVAVGGQRNKHGTDHPGPVTSDTWKAQLPQKETRSPDAREVYFAGKSILFMTHNLSLTGAPMLLMEAAGMLIDAGASVRVASLGGDSAQWNLASRMQVPVIPLEMAEAQARRSDFVVVNTVSAASMSWIRETAHKQPELASKLVSWVHEIDVAEFQPQGSGMKDARLVIFDSKACRDVWQAELGPLEQSVVIHPSVDRHLKRKLGKEQQAFPLHPGTAHSDTSLLTRAEVREKLGVSDDDFLVLCLGTVEPRKGQTMLVETISELAHKTGLPVKLALVGFKHQRRRAGFFLRRSLRDWNVLSPSRCFVQQAEIAAFYKAADAFVMNSQGIAGDGGEGFGRVTIEAMTAGAVALGTNSGGTAEIIEDGVSGFLFPVGKPGQSVLADRLAALMKDPSLVARLSAGGQKRAAEHFSAKRFLGQFEQAFMQAFEARDESNPEAAQPLNE